MFKILLTELILNNTMHSSQQTSKTEGVLDSQEQVLLSAWHGKNDD